MAIDLEKNDVDISSLFKWRKEGIIRSTDGKEIARVWLRLVGDSEMNRARIFALRESAKLRAALRTEDTDEYQAFISEIKMQNRDTMMAAIKLFNMGKYGEEAKKNADIKFPADLTSDATLEEQEKYQKEIDEFPEIYGKAIDKQVHKILTREDKRFESMTEEDLQKEYTAEYVNYLCQNEMQSKFMNMCIYFATYRDKKFKKRVFETIEDYENAAQELKRQLLEIYNAIDMPVEKIKKLPEATPSQ